MSITVIARVHRLFSPLLVSHGSKNKHRNYHVTLSRRSAMVNCEFSVNKRASAPSTRVNEPTLTIGDTRTVDSTVNIRNEKIRFLPTCRDRIAISLNVSVHLTRALSSRVTRDSRSRDNAPSKIRKSNMFANVSAIKMDAPPHRKRVTRGTIVLNLNSSSPSRRRGGVIYR